MPHADDHEKREGTEAGSARSPAPADRPTLLFVRRSRSGPSRKMESLVAWVRVTQKKRLRVVDLDVDRHPALAAKLGVRQVPSLLLVDGRSVVSRLDGRATGRQIQELIRPYV
jgi:thioredoxin 1